MRVEGIEHLPSLTQTSQRLMPGGEQPLNFDLQRPQRGYIQQACATSLAPLPSLFPPPLISVPPHASLFILCPSLQLPCPPSLFLPSIHLPTTPLLGIPYHPKAWTQYSTLSFPLPPHPFT